MKLITLNSFKGRSFVPEDIDIFLNLYSIETSEYISEELLYNYFFSNFLLRVLNIEFIQYYQLDIELSEVEFDYKMELELI